MYTSDGNSCIIFWGISVIRLKLVRQLDGNQATAKAQHTKPFSQLAPGLRINISHNLRASIRPSNFQPAHKPITSECLPPNPPHCPGPDLLPRALAVFLERHAGFFAAKLFRDVSAQPAQHPPAPPSVQHRVETLLQCSLPRPACCSPLSTRN